jgi:hypothetical protein
VDDPLTYEPMDALDAWILVVTQFYLKAMVPLSLIGVFSFAASIHIAIADRCAVTNRIVVVEDSMHGVTEMMPFDQLRGSRAARVEITHAVLIVVRRANLSRLTLFWRLH